jgi:hypothetical protein
MSLHSELKTLAAAAKSEATPSALIETSAILSKGSPYTDAFFEFLTNASWLLPLHEKGYFSQAPEVMNFPDGSSQHPYSPGLSALSRFTAIEPELVAAILRELSPVSNSTVNGQILRLIASLPASHSIRLYSLVEAMVQNQEPSTELWLIDILTVWIQAKNYDEVFHVVSLSLSQDSRTSTTRQRHTLDELDRNILSVLGEARPIALVELLLEALKQGNTKRSQGPTNFLSTETDEPPHFFLESFTDDTTSLFEFESILCRRLFQIGRSMFEHNSKEEVIALDALIRSYPWTLTKRLRWQIYAAVPQNSLNLARQDVLFEIHNKTLWQDPDIYELAQMLESMCQIHGAAFLSGDDLEGYLALVFDAGDLGDTEAIQARAERLQLARVYPVRSLLTGKQLKLYEDLAQKHHQPKMEDYKPFRTRGGTVQEVPPAETNRMALMRDVELWEFLNTWKPGARKFEDDDWLKEESARALGISFSKFIQSQPERFLPETQWWRNLTHPECLSQPLERAAHRIAKKEEVAPDSSEIPPTDHDWQNWFGIAHWIAESASETIPDSGEEGRPNWPWNWPCMLTISFLKAAQKEPKFEPPSDLKASIGPLLARFAVMPDPHLVETTRHWLVDWLTTAINSLRGTAVEGLLDLAVQQKAKSKTHSPEPWLFDTLEQVLRVPGQSPAIFGLMGARANLLLYLFLEELKTRDGSNLLLPPASFEARAAFVTAHYRYSSAFPQLLTIIPDLPQIALDILVQFESESKPPNERGQGFAHRLGVHLAHYVWNAAYRNDDVGWAALDRFFEVAKSSSRSQTLIEIGRLFSPVPFNEEQKDLFIRAMVIWERRSAQIFSASDISDFHDELAAFAEWFGAACFPFEWRYQHFTQVLQVLPETPKMFRFMETLRIVALDQGHLTESLHILQQVLSKARFPEFGWAYREDEIKVILQAGIHATDSITRQIAEEVRELLLRHRCFEYLDL